MREVETLTILERISASLDARFPGKTIADLMDMAQALVDVQHAVSEFNAALARREHGGIAMARSMRLIEAALAANI